MRRRLRVVVANGYGGGNTDKTAWAEWLRGLKRPGRPMVVLGCELDGLHHVIEGTRGARLFTGPTDGSKPTHGNRETGVIIYGRGRVTQHDAWQLTPDLREPRNIAHDRWLHRVAYKYGGVTTDLYAWHANAAIRSDRGGLNGTRRAQEWRKARGKIADRLDGTYRLGRASIAGCDANEVDRPNVDNLRAVFTGQRLTWRSEELMWLAWSKHWRPQRIHVIPPARVPGVGPGEHPVIVADLIRTKR